MRLPYHNMDNRRVVDLVPLVNVIFLLMFFFLLSWSFVLQPGIEVRLPSTNFPTTSQQGSHVITLKTTTTTTQSEPLIFFDESNVDETELRVCLKIAARKSFGDWITLNADDSISHGYVQKVASMAMEHGFHVTIATQWLTSPSKKKGA